MRFIKPFLILISALVMVLLGISALMPAQVMTSKWMITRVPKDSVLQEIGRLSEWTHWNGLLMQVKDISITPEKGQAEVGSSLGWTDQRGGRNRLEVTALNQNGMVTRLTLSDGRPMESGFSVEKRKGDSVQVVWFIIEKMKWYPWEKFYGMMAADMKGPLMQESLQRLKGKLERTN